MNTMSLTLHQLLVGVAFQPRKEVALNSSSFHRGWKAAPTEITPSLKLMKYNEICSMRRQMLAAVAAPQDSLFPSAASPPACKPMKPPGWKRARRGYSAYASESVFHKSSIFNI